MAKDPGNAYIYAWRSRTRYYLEDLDGALDDDNRNIFIDILECLRARMHERDTQHKNANVDNSNKNTTN